MKRLSAAPWPPLPKPSMIRVSFWRNLWSIIEAHGGRLWATKCEPRGALFQFTIPAD